MATYASRAADARSVYFAPQPEVKRDAWNSVCFWSENLSPRETMVTAHQVRWLTSPQPRPLFVGTHRAQDLALAVSSLPSPIAPLRPTPTPAHSPHALLHGTSVATAVAIDPAICRCCRYTSPPLVDTACHHQSHASHRTTAAVVAATAISHSHGIAVIRNPHKVQSLNNLLADASATDPFTPVFSE